MQNFKAWYHLNGWVIRKIHPLTVVMKSEISYIDQNLFLNQAVNVFFLLFVTLGILTWGVYGIDSLWSPASSGQSTNYSLSHFRVGFESERAGGYRLMETSALDQLSLWLARCNDTALITFKVKLWWNIMSIIIWYIKLQITKYW